MNLYRKEHSDPKINAQRNLCGRTHYVDDDTLRYHKSRILSAYAICNGMLFCIVTSDALDARNTRRGFRYVVFDVFGTVLGATSLEEAYGTSDKARRACEEFVSTVDAVRATFAGIANAEIKHANEMKYLREDVARALGQKVAA